MRADSLPASEAERVIERPQTRPQPVSAAAGECDHPGVDAGAIGTRGVSIVGAGGT
jgi:hypothetical protein